MFRYLQSVAEESRTRTIRPFAEAVAAPLPPHVTPSMLPDLGVWPPEQSSRDAVVRLLERGLVGPSSHHSQSRQRYGGAGVPEAEAKLAAAAIEAAAFAFITDEYTAGVTLASDHDRFVVAQAYCKAYAFRLFDFYESRAPPPSVDSEATAPPAA
jgi:hypothetical protein